MSLRLRLATLSLVLVLVLTSLFILLFQNFPENQLFRKTNHLPAPTLTPSVLGTQTKSSGCLVSDYLPDSACTPGHVFPQATAKEICPSGYSETARNVSTSAKEEIYRRYGISNRQSGEYEIDHLVPLMLGGSNELANLWPQRVNTRLGTNQKDKASLYLRRLVCSGQMDLHDAQFQIASDWTKVYLSLP